MRDNCDDSTFNFCKAGNGPPLNSVIHNDKWELKASLDGLKILLTSIQ